MLRKTAKLTLEKAALQKINKPEISLILTGNQDIQALNLKYRNKDMATDVLSFPMQDNWKDINEAEINGTILLGDVVISVEKAIEQADNYGHSLQRELLFLFVHGLLHLLGYDHLEKEDEEKMCAMQNMVLDQLGLER